MMFFRENKYRQFWTWFEQNSEQIFNFEADVEKVFDLLGNELKKVDKNLTFEFGPIEENNKRKFIISADGIKESFGEVENLYFLKPELEKWEIVKFRQRKDLMRFGIKIDDTMYSAKDIYFKLFSDGSKIGILIFVKDYNEKLHGTLVFLMLDMALGEYDVETKVGAIECYDIASEYFVDALPFTELPENFDVVYTKMTGKN